MRPLRLGCAAISSLLALIGSCAIEQELELTERALLSEASYTLDWAWGDARAMAGGGWEVTSDRGTQIRLERGYVVTYRAQLAPCSDVETARGLFTVRSARAGHGEDVDDSASGRPWVESLTAPSMTALGHAAFDAREYCHVHYLVARGSNDTTNLPADVGMIGKSLYVEGTYQLAGGTQTPFLITTTEATAILTPLGQLAVSGSGLVADISIARRLDTLFDGVDFATGEHDDIARQILRNLSDYTVIEVHRRTAE